MRFTILVGLLILGFVGAAPKKGGSEHEDAEGGIKSHAEKLQDLEEEEKGVNDSKEKSAESDDEKNSKEDSKEGEAKEQSKEESGEESKEEPSKEDQEDKESCKLFSQKIFKIQNLNSFCVKCFIFRKILPKKKKSH